MMLLKSALTVVLCLSTLSAHAEFSPNQVIAAGKVKRNVYVNDSIITGGDALANPVNLSTVRWAANKGFERIVIDLTGEGSAWETKVPPYFQVSVNSNQQKLGVSIHGVSARQLDREKLSQSFRRSSIISQSYLAPAMEGDLAALEFHTKGPVDAEAFYLVSPPRIVIDVRSQH